MEVTGFLEDILNEKTYSDELLERDEIHISLPKNNNVVLKYNGLNSYNFEVSDGNEKLVEAVVENIRNKFFLRESTILNTDGSRELKTIYYKDYKIISSQSKTDPNSKNYYIHRCRANREDFTDLITKNKIYWDSFDPKNNRIAEFTRNIKTGEFLNFEGEKNIYPELKAALNSMLNDILDSTEEYNKATTQEFIIFSCFLKSIISTAQFRIPDFKNLDLGGDISPEDFIEKLNLKISDNNNPINFAIVPVMASGHISLMFIDLREGTKSENRIKHLDNSLAHYDNSIESPILKAEIFKGLTDKVEALSTEKPQFGGCCGILINHNLEQISQVEFLEEGVIEELFENIRSSKFQTKMITNILRDMYNVSVIENKKGNTVTIKEKADLPELLNSYKIPIINLDYFKNLLLKRKYNIIDNKNILDKTIECQKINLLKLYSDKFSHVVDIMNKKIYCLSEISLTPFNKDNMIKAIMLIESSKYQIRLFEESLKEKIDDINEKIFVDDEISIKNNETNKKIIGDYKTFNKLKNEYQEAFKKYEKIYQSLISTKNYTDEQPDNFEKNVDMYIELSNKQKKINEYYNGLFGKYSERLQESVNYLLNDLKVDFFENSKNSEKYKHFKILHENIPIKIDKNSDGELVINLNTKSIKLFRDIEEVKIHLPNNVKEIDDKFIDNLSDKISNQGFANDIVDLNNISIKRLNSNHYEPMGKFVNNDIMSNYRGVNSMEKTQTGSRGI